MLLFCFSIFQCSSTHGPISVGELCLKRKSHKTIDNIVFLKICF